MSSSSKKLRWVVIVLLVLMLGAAGAVGVKVWKKYVIRSQDNRFYNSAQTYLKQRRNSEALAVIDQRNRSVKTQTTEAREKWFDLEVEALGQANQVARLVDLYLASTNDFYVSEKRGLIMGRAILHRQDMEAFDKFRVGWKNRESNQPAWFVLDGDALLLKGKRAEGIKWFNSRTFPGAADSDRLMRLAMLDIPENVPRAMGFLDKAVTDDPRNADVRLFRGQLFESYGQMGRARIEYVASFLIDTNNTDMRDRLGEFYRRGGSYDLAVKTWLAGVSASATSENIWLKAIFWSRIARNMPFDWKSVTPPPGDLQSFLEYLIQLPPGKFWDDPAFERLPQARRYTSDQQAVFWFKLLAALQSKNSEEASRLLEFNKFRSQSWNIQVESILLRVLTYRKTGELKFPVGVNLPLSTAPAGSRPEFLEQLDSYTRSAKGKVPAEVDRILRSDSIFGIIFLLNGWAEATLQMPAQEVLPADFPDWVAYGYAQAHLHERGPEDALAFAAKQKSSPLLEVFTAEILVDNGKVDDGIARLTPLATANTEVSMRAATDLAKARINRKEYDLARAAIENQPLLRDALSGKELLAGVSIMQGRKPEAEKIYRSILEESDDAKIYFGKQAYDNKDWATARKLTEELIAKYPDRLQFRANLESINQGEKGK